MLAPLKKSTTTGSGSVDTIGLSCADSSHRHASSQAAAMSGSSAHQGLSRSTTAAPHLLTASSCDDASHRRPAPASATTPSQPAAPHLLTASSCDDASNG